VKWAFWIDGQANSPALSPDGATAYIVQFGHNLYAINTADGSQKWTFETDGYTSSPAIADDGTIYVGGFPGGLYAINPDASLKWYYPIFFGPYDHSPAIGPDGAIYVGSDEGFHAINSNNTLKWEWRGNYESGKTTSDPAIAPDGAVYVGLRNSLPDIHGPVYFIRAFNANGTTKWDYPDTAAGETLPQPVTSTPAIGWDGTIYVGVENSLYAFNPGGAPKWEVVTGGQVGSPAIGPDGTIYVGSNDHYLYAVNPDGSKKWVYDGKDELGWAYGRRGPAIGDDGIIYLSASNGVHAIKPDGALQWRDLSCWSNSSPVIGPDGTVYVGVGYSLIAFQSTSTGLADSAWPMFHHDPQHTGLSGAPPPPPDPPVADFSASPGSGYAPLTVLFQDNSTGEISDRSWNFGDGSGAYPYNSPSPSHTYKNPGDYTVTLTVTGPGGSDTRTGSVTVTAPPLPVADFTAAPTSGFLPLAVQFTDLSIGYITGRSWDFGDGASMPVPNPSHTYTAAGNYTVTLYVGNYSGATSKTAAITVLGPPMADFTADLTSGPAPLMVQFTDTSAGAVASRSWEFGDGATSAAANPTHTYNNPGTYTVKLTVANPAGSSSKTATITATQVILTDKTTVNVPKGGTATIGVKLRSQPTADTVVSAAKVSGIAEITIVAGSSLTFTSANWATYQWVKLAATNDDINLNGQAVIQLSAAGAAPVNVTAVKTGKGGKATPAFIELLLLY